MSAGMINNVMPTGCNSSRMIRAGDTPGECAIPMEDKFTAVIHRFQSEQLKAEGKTEKEENENEKGKRQEKHEGLVDFSSRCVRLPFTEEIFTKPED